MELPKRPLTITEYNTLKRKLCLSKQKIKDLLKRRNTFGDIVKVTDEILIYEGDNDLGGSIALEPRRFLAQCREFVAYVRKKSPDTRFYFLSIKPSTARMQKWRAMKRGNDLLRQYARSDPRIHYIDIASEMLNEDGTIKAGLIGKDGVHMTPAGYRIWSAVLRSSLVRSK